MCSGNTWSTLSECQRYRYFKRRAFYWRLLMFGAIPTFSPSPLPFGTCCNTYLQHFVLYMYCTEMGAAGQISLQLHVRVRGVYVE